MLTGKPLLARAAPGMIVLAQRALSCGVSGRR